MTVKATGSRYKLPISVDFMEKIFHKCIFCTITNNKLGNLCI